MKLFKRISLILGVMLTLSMSSVTAYALYHPDSFYDEISWTWEYSAPYTNSYNCLGYATSSMTWEWPWGGEPTSSEVTSYLSGKGYSTSGNWAQIVSYGSSGSIKHFGKVTGTDWSHAKWGGLERFNHGSWNPYYSDSVYGPQQKVYYCRRCLL